MEKSGNNRQMKSGMATKPCISWTLNIMGYNVNIAGSSQITSETQTQPTQCTAYISKDHRHIPSTIMEEVHTKVVSL